MKMGDGEEEYDDDVGEKWAKHYSSNHQILLVGDGDFSFSLSLARSFGSASNIVATSLDPYDVVIKKYKEAKSNLESLEKLGASLLHGVDATTMNCQTELRMRKFDRIIFNFPHAGFRGKEDNNLVILHHRSLVYGFFRNARSMLRPDGEIHINHKTTAPFCNWDIEKLASWNSLALIELVEFKIEDYPGYKHKRGDGSRCDEPFPLGQCSTFKFWLYPTTNKMHRRREQWHAYVASLPVHELRFGFDTDMPLNHGNGTHMLPEFSRRTCYNVSSHVNEYKYGGFNRDMMIMNSDGTLNLELHVLPQCKERDWYGGGYSVNEPRFGYDGDMVGVHPQRNSNLELARMKALSLVRKYGNQEDSFWKN